jgi:hypothetical protein
MSTPPASAFPQTAAWNASIFGGPGVTVGSDILYPALRLLRLIRPGQGPQPEILTEALAALNSMIDSWNIERLMIYAVLRSVFTLVASDGDYSIGPSGDWLVDSRPSRVEKAGLIDISNPAQPLELPIEVLTLDKWKAITLKSLASTLPLSLYYDQNLDVGSGMVYVWPVPTVANQVALYLWRSLLMFQSVEEAFDVPQGYLRALKYNLAVELAPSYENAVLSPRVVQTAAESKARIKSLNAPSLVMRCDSGLLNNSGGGSDWRTGQ